MPFGSIDSLGFSLDDGIWLSTTTCAKIASAEITGTGTLTATADFRLPIFISGSITGVGTLTSDAFLERLAAGAITGFGSLSASVSRIQTVEGAILGSGSLSASVQRVQFVDGSITGTGSLTAGAFKQRLVSGSITGTGSLSALAGFTAEGTGRHYWVWFAYGGDQFHCKHTGPGTGCRNDYLLLVCVW